MDQGHTIGGPRGNMVAMRWNRPLLSYLSLLLLAVAALGSTATSAAALTGIVTRVWDGDTISLATDSGDHRVRLTGIDAPEHDQPYGDPSARHLEHLLLNKEVRVESHKSDVYGRLLGKVWVQPIDCPRCGKTLDANLAMLTVGLAWWYRYYKDDQSPEDQGRYEFAEYEAKAKKAGLWADETPTPPWDWPRGDSAYDPPPGECRIKGNISANGRIYHLPGQQHYEDTRVSVGRGERWFCTEVEARSAGWRRAKR
jgi:endonuclease YncB( thermonuclease family)